MTLRWSYLHIKQIQISQDWSEIRNSCKVESLLLQKFFQIRRFSSIQPNFSFHIPFKPSLNANIVSTPAFSVLMSYPLSLPLTLHNLVIVIISNLFIYLSVNYSFSEDVARLRTFKKSSCILLGIDIYPKIMTRRKLKMTRIYTRKKHDMRGCINDGFRR